MQKELHSERLRLVPFSSVDKDLFLRLNTTPFVRKYLWDDQVISDAMAADVIQQNDKHFEEDQYGLWKIQVPGNNEVIGYAGLWYFFEEPQPQLIYALSKAYTQQGYATEAAARIIRYAFEELGFKYLLAAMDEPHRASQGVAERLGMALEEKRVEDGKATVFYQIKNDKV